MGAGLRETKSAKSALVHALGVVLGEERLPAVLHELGRDELRAVCRAHETDGSKSQRGELIEALLKASGYDPRASWRIQPPVHDGLPEEGQVLAARGRQWLVERVRSGSAHESPLLELACLDDDAPGKKLEMLWDLEIGARV